MKLPRSEECKNGDHKKCDGTVPRGFDEQHDKECACQCHETRPRDYLWPPARTTLTKTHNKATNTLPTKGRKP